jgi:hypothetical protein
VHPTAAVASLACLALPFLTLGYLLACAAWPFTACPRCHGTGRLASPSGRAWRRCRRCQGHGARIRLGRHLWNRIRRTARASK